MDNQENKKQAGASRRDILKLGALSAIAACGGILASCNKTADPKEETGEKVKLLSPDGQLVEVDKKYLRFADQTVRVSAEEARRGIPGRKFVMVIDLAKCKNARKCVAACQKSHLRPESKEWLQVKLLKNNEDAAPYWFPKTCFHCDNPPCVKVCPVDATFKRTDGLVLIDNDRCIGCKFCMAACPYSTRVFNWEEPKFPEDLVKMCAAPETGVPGRIGTVEKCDFCPDMAREGLLPHCVSACPNGVFYFGDQNEDAVTNGEETVRFSDMIRDRSGYRFAEDLGTQPRVWYLPPRDRLFPVERGLDGKPESLKKRFEGLLENTAENADE